MYFDLFYELKLLKHCFAMCVFLLLIKKMRQIWIENNSFDDIFLLMKGRRIISSSIPILLGTAKLLRKTKAEAFTIFCGWWSKVMKANSLNCLKNQLDGGRMKKSSQVKLSKMELMSSLKILGWNEREQWLSQKKKSASEEMTNLPKSC